MSTPTPREVLAWAVHWDKTGHYWYDDRGNEVSHDDMRSALSMAVGEADRLRRLLERGRQIMAQSGLVRIQAYGLPGAVVFGDWTEAVDKEIGPLPDTAAAAS